jgi:hypothetical protein
LQYHFYIQLAISLQTVQLAISLASAREACPALQSGNAIICDAGKVIPLPEGSQLMHLMEQDLSSEWERQALQDLSAAPHSEAPPSLEAEKAAVAASKAESGGGKGKGKAVEVEVGAEGKATVAELQQWSGMTEEEKDAAWYSYWEQCYGGYQQGGGWGDYGQQQGPGSAAAAQHFQHTHTGHSGVPYSTPYGWHASPSFMQLPHSGTSYGQYLPPTGVYAQQVRQWPVQQERGLGANALAVPGLSKGGLKAGGAGGQVRGESKKVGRGDVDEEGELSDAVLFGKSVGKGGEGSRGGVEVEPSGRGEQGTDGLTAEEEEEEEEREGVEEAGGSSAACSDVPGDDDLDEIAASLLDNLDLHPPQQQQQQQQHKQQQAPHQAGLGSRQHGEPPIPSQGAYGYPPHTQQGSWPGYPSSTNSPSCGPYPQHSSPSWHGSEYYNGQYFPSSGSHHAGGPLPYHFPHQPPAYHSSSSCHVPPPPSFPPSLPTCDPRGGMSSSPSLQCPSCSLLSFQAQYNTWVQHYSQWYTDYCCWYAREQAEVQAEELAANT